LLSELIDAAQMTGQKTKETLMAAGLRLSGPLTCYFLVMEEWKGKSREHWKQHLEELHYLQESILDLLSGDEHRVAWKGSDGIGIIHSGIIPDKDKKQYQEDIAERLRQIVEDTIVGLTVKIGIAEITANAADVRDRYRQSYITVSTGRKIWPERKIYHYLDLGIFQILPTSRNQTEVEDYIERNLGNLIRYEKNKKTEFLLTLEALLESDNLKAAAQKLFVHEKTMQFRKKQIEQILGVSLASFETRMVLAAALKLRKLG